MVKHYGMPCKENAEEIYKYWPDEILTCPGYRYKPGMQVKMTEKFSMGKLSFLFGKIAKPSEKDKVLQSQRQQSALMKMRMKEYLTTIVEKPYADNALAAFDQPEKYSFVDRCGDITYKYRNKAAHTDVVPQKDAQECCETILGKYNAYRDTCEVTGILMELFDKIDIHKVLKQG